VERRTARESREQIYTSAPRRLEKTVRADQSVPLLAGGVPNLGLDDLAVDLEAAGGELDADGGLGLEAELVLGEAGEEVGLADAGVADEHDLEEVVALVHPVRHPIERARTQAPSRRRGAVLPGGTPLARRTGRDSIRPHGFSARVGI